ncbi:glycosyltransferase [Candidatus Saccharibacteria bacterium]|nr:glycosyltransferase [Candidatus Saccharibacteria bacterium]
MSKTTVKKHIAILIPAYNEEEVFPALKKRLIKLRQNMPNYQLEFLFVNDGSRDLTMELVKKWALIDDSVSYVSLSRNFGKEIAMIAGFDHAITADATIIIDADLQDPPELIPEMVALWEDGYDDVYARRTSRKGETWLKRSTSKLFYKLLQNTTNIPIQRDTGDFRLLSQRCVESLTLIREQQRYTKGLFSWVGYRKKELLYERAARVAGTSKWNYFRLIDLAIEGITSFTTVPLRIASLFGILTSFASAIYIIFIIIRTIMFGSDLAGYPSMMAVILFLGGVQLLSIGVIGEYIGRIFNETKQRPLYFTDEVHRGKDSEKSAS